MLGTLFSGALKGLLRSSPRRHAPFPSGGFVAFVTNVDSVQRVNPDCAYDSGIASTRLRVLIPARELARRVPVWLVPLDTFIADPTLARLGRAGAIIIGKLPVRSVLQQADALRQMISFARSRGGSVPLYADLSDDYAAFARAENAPFLAEYQEALGGICTLIVTCAALEAALRTTARRGILVIEDPYEDPRAQTVRVSAGAPVRFAWFGNLAPLNSPQLERAFVRVASGLSDMPVEIEVVADASVRDVVTALGGRLRTGHSRLRLSFTPWSLEATRAAIDHCDFVLLPQDHASDWARVKSHNRLVAAIRGGRLALASPIPSYRELAAYAWVDEDLAAGARWALAHPPEAMRRVSDGQHYCEERFSPSVIGRRWADALGLNPAAPNG